MRTHPHCLRSKRVPRRRICVGLGHDERGRRWQGWKSWATGQHRPEKSWCCGQKYLLLSNNEAFVIRGCLLGCCVCVCGCVVCISKMYLQTAGAGFGALPVRSCDWWRGREWEIFRQCLSPFDLDGRKQVTVTVGKWKDLHDKKSIIEWGEKSSCWTTRRQGGACHHCSQKKCYDITGPGGVETKTTQTRQWHRWCPVCGCDLKFHT